MPSKRDYKAAEQERAARESGRSVGHLCGEGDEEVGITTEEWEIDAVETGLSS